MPLARIVARVAEIAHVLAEDLRARGFEVQTRLPDEKSSEPADLEIILEDCAIEDALAGAARAPISQDVWVFIAPGAVSENLRSIRIASLIPEEVAAKPVLEMKAEPEVRAALAESGVLPDLDPGAAATAIGDLGPAHEVAEDVPAMMTFQGERHATEPLLTPESESNLIPIDGKVISSASDHEVRLEPLGEVQESPFEPEAVITGWPESISSSPALEPVAAEEWGLEEPQSVVFETEVADEASPSIQERMEPVSMEPPATSSNERGLPSYRVRIPRMSQHERLFWKIAPLASMLTLAFLLLAASSHRFSPVPAGLVSNSRETRGSIPFAAIKSGTTNTAQTKNAVTAAPSAQNPAASVVKPSAAKLHTLSPAVSNSLLSNPPVSKADRAGTANTKVSLASSREREVAPTNRQHSLASSDADYVARDTIVRHGARSAAADYVAKDTVVRYRAHPTGAAAPPRK
jgi:hypothetical protein